MTTQTIEKKRLKVGNTIIEAMTRPEQPIESVTVRTRTAIAVAPASDQYTHDRTWFVRGSIMEQVRKEDLIRWARTPSQPFETIPDHLVHKRRLTIKKFLWGLLP